MRVVCQLLRFPCFLGALYLWGVVVSYLSLCVPDVLPEQELTHTWWNRGKEFIILQAGEGLSAGPEYWESPAHMTFRFLMTKGSVLLLRYHGRLIEVHEEELSRMETARTDSPEPWWHSLTPGYPNDLLDGEPLPPHCCRPIGHKGIDLRNIGTGLIELTDLRVVRPASFRTFPLHAREAPRTAEELLYRTKVWARYLYYPYPYAPPPLPISGFRIISG